jgi:MFS family permease
LLAADLAHMTPSRETDCEPPDYQSGREGREERMSAPRTGVEEWRSSWQVALAGLCGMSTLSVHLYSIGAFVIPIEAEFGWSRAAISASLTIALLITAAFGPVVGLAIDRFGPRRVGVPGVVIFSIAYAMMSTVGHSEVQWYVYSSVLGLACVMISSPIWATGVSATFNRSRGLALAVTLCGSSVSAFLTPFVTSIYIAEFGWRTAYVAVGATWAVVVIPFIFFAFRTPLDRRRTVADRAGEILKPGLEVREGLRSSAFYKIFIGTGAISIAVVSVGAMMVPVLVTAGLSAIEASGIAAALGIASLSGRLVSGFLMDRLPANIVASLFCLLPMISCALFLLFPGSGTAATFAAIFIGLALGSELDATAYLASRHLGLRRFGTLFGIIGMAMAAGSAIGPMGFSYIYDVTRSYTLGLWLLIPLSLLASISFLSVGRSAPFQAEADGAADPVAMPNAGPGACFD